MTYDIRVFETEKETSLAVILPDGSFAVFHVEAGSVRAEVLRRLRDEHLNKEKHDLLSVVD